VFTALRNKLFGSKNGNDSSSQGRSKKLARSRLHFVLVQDRTGLTPEEMSQFKREMVSVIERYFQIDEQGFDISYKRDSDTTTLLINSPVIVRRKEPSEASKESRKGKAQTANA
jgi:cell division topological specificity factor